MVAVLEKGTTIIAWKRVSECYSEDRMDVRQNQGVCEVFSSGKGDGTDFLH